MLRKKAPGAPGLKRVRSLVLTRRSNVSPKHKSCKVRGSSPTPGEAMSANAADVIDIGLTPNTESLKS
jgi:hypothetical protein